MILNRAGVAQVSAWMSSRAWLTRWTPPWRCSRWEGFQGMSMLTCCAEALQIKAFKGGFGGADQTDHAVLDVALELFAGIDG